MCWLLDFRLVISISLIVLSWYRKTLHIHYSTEYSFYIIWRELRSMQTRIEVSKRISSGANIFNQMKKNLESEIGVELSSVRGTSKMRSLQNMEQKKSSEQQTEKKKGKYSQRSHRQRIEVIHFQTKQQNYWWNPFLYMRNELI